MSNAPRSERAKRDWGQDDSGTPILHVDMDSFFAAVEVLDNPELRDRPVIVGGLGNRGVVTSCTYDVRAKGVKAGMPINQARALAPEATVLPGRHWRYREISALVMGLMASFSSDFEPISIDEAFLDVAGARRRLGSPEEIARQLRALIRAETGLPASVGIGATKTVAKIASSHAKPDGVLLIPADATVDFLHSLPIGALPGAGKKTVESLERWGIDTVQQLAHTDLSVLVKLMGEIHARQILKTAWGEDNRPVGTTAKEKSISTEETFSVNLIARREIETFLLRAGHNCAARLRKLELVAWTIQIKLRDAKFRTITRSVTLSAPTDLGREIGQAAVALFRKEASPAGGVRLAGVGVQGLVTRDEGFQVALDEDPRPLATERAMDAVKDRFGWKALGPAALLNSATRSNGRNGTLPSRMGE